MWNNELPKEEWSLAQLNARFVEMWQELSAAVAKEAERSVTQELLHDREIRESVGLQARRMRKVAWEMGNVADEWLNRDADIRLA